MLTAQRNHLSDVHLLVPTVLDTSLQPAEPPVPLTSADDVASAHLASMVRRQARPIHKSPVGRVKVFHERPAAMQADPEVTPRQSFDAQRAVDEVVLPADAEAVRRAPEHIWCPASGLAPPLGR